MNADYVEESWIVVISTGEGARLAGPGADGTTVQLSRQMQASSASAGDGQPRRE